MRSLFWKGMLAFFIVILVAVGTVALLSNWITETEFRRYAFAHGGQWERQLTELHAYYVEHGSWAGLQDALPLLSGMHRGEGPGRGATGSELHFRVTDAAGVVVADTTGSPAGVLSSTELRGGLTIELAGKTIGHLLPIAVDGHAAAHLAPEQTEFLERVHTVLWIAALAAVSVALLVGGLLFRSIIAPLQRLTTASQTIASGDLSARAEVQGQDEIAQLATSFNQMADNLARAAEARRHQTADVAHELRTPLTIIRGILEAMLDEVYPTDRANLQASLAQVHTLSRLVQDLQLLALADAGELHIHPAPLELPAFLSQVVESYQLQATERQITLALDTPPTLPPIQADRDRLAQVLGNLLSNALRYLSPGGKIVVRATAQPGEVLVSVSDDGPGIPAEDLPHLFERFWRGDRARSRATGGSGLGLTIARSLIAAHGGRLWAASTEGEGSTFTFTLPLDDGSGTAA
ncbi:MAG TPA: HAMP domain-containing protein [Thermoflexia bacterium]|nr:HAMP domain-containing protein [Thermoflexia bacterium]